MFFFWKNIACRESAVRANADNTAVKTGAEKFLRKIGIKKLGDVLPDLPVFFIDAYRIPRPLNLENIKECKKEKVIPCLIMHSAGLGFCGISVGLFAASKDWFSLIAMGVFGIYNSVAALLNLEHLLRINRLLKMQK